jgi:flagellar protein FlaG
MDSAEKMSQLNARALQPAVASAPISKLHVADESGKGVKQPDERESVQQAAEQLQQLSREEVKQAADDISSFVQNIQRNLNFSVHDETGKPIIKVTDTETDEMIRQIPTEEVLQLQKYIHDAAGILFKAKV